MEIVLLMDNTVLPGREFEAEHGLSFYLEADGKKILFDSGHTDTFIKNALKMNINLSKLDYVVLSHGHNDHSCGLSELLSYYSEELKQRLSKPVLITHPATFDKKVDENMLDIGCSIPHQQLVDNFVIKHSNKPLNITEKLIFLGEIPRVNDFEAQKPYCKVCRNDICEDDYLFDDSALVYTSSDGLVIITGCSHSGICNIIDYAQKVCQETRIRLVIGGFHLMNPAKSVMGRTVDYLEQQQIKELYPCHCTDFESKKILIKYLEVKETGIGLNLNID
jgi:7,8-dihydropterin-6-yl-methyl-4-(beta-D-ribofuranosyl)aminobenzene 5'-phosphate synthase